MISAANMRTRSSYLALAATLALYTLPSSVDGAALLRVARGDTRVLVVVSRDQ